MNLALNLFCIFIISRKDFKALTGILWAPKQSYFPYWLLRYFYNSSLHSHIYGFVPSCKAKKAFITKISMGKHNIMHLFNILWLQNNFNRCVGSENTLYIKSPTPREILFHNLSLCQDIIRTDNGSILNF